MKLGYLGLQLFILSLFGALILWLLPLMGVIEVRWTVYLAVWISDTFLGLLGLGVGICFDPFPAHVEEQNYEN